MRRVAITLAVVLALLLGAGLTASAQELTKAERDRAIKYLKDTEKILKKETKGLNEAQWTFKASAESWSVKDCLEHLALTEDLIHQMLNERLMKSPAAPEKFTPAVAKEKDDWVLKAIPDRSSKFQAPEPIRPSGKWATTDEMWKHFAAARKVTIQQAKSEDGLRVHFMDHPLKKELDGYSWLLLIAAHTERHTKQIQEVKANANFPKK